jgi:signal transduction histidine kinase
MKIKTQFNLLIAGIILVPFLAGFSQVLLWRLRQDRSPPVIPLYEELSPVFQPSFTLQDWKLFRNFALRLRPNTDLLLFTGDMTAVFSSMENFTPGEKITWANIFKLIHSGSSRYGYTLESPPWLREGQFFLLLRNDRQAPVPPNPAAFFISTLLFIIFVHFAFVLIMSLLITRSITRSVLVLENATRRIASGDLDLNPETQEQNLHTPDFLRGDNEITSLTYSLNRMRLALKEEEQGRSRFIMGVTHDLKTPLSLIKGYAEAIHDGVICEPEARTESLSIIADKVDQLEGMIEDLINFVRLDTGQWRRQLKPVDLKCFLAAFARRFKDDAELLRRRSDCDLRLPEGIRLPMDEGLVSRALENLVINALRYTRETDLIRLRAFTRDLGSGGPGGGGSVVIIQIEDSGPGIAPSDLSHVFEMFYRGDNSRRGPGMGLGLSVVKGVMDSHGWDIVVQSPIPPANNEETAGGARFTITIPC